MDVRRIGVVLGVVGALCVGCSEDPGEVPTPATPTSSAPSAPATPTASPTSSPTPTITRRPPAPSEDPDPTPTPLEADTETDTQTPDGAAALIDVEVRTQPGFDEIAFVLGDDSTIGWEVGYTDDPRSAGSGDPVEVAGEHVLAVRLTGILAPFDAPGSRDRQNPDVSASTSLVEAVDDAWFEGQWVFFVGVDTGRPFRVVQEGDRVLLQVDTTS